MFSNKICFNHMNYLIKLEHLATDMLSEALLNHKKEASNLQKLNREKMQIKTYGISERINAGKS